MGFILRGILLFLLELSARNRETVEELIPTKKRGRFLVWRGSTSINYSKKKSDIPSFDDYGISIGKHAGLMREIVSRQFVEKYKIPFMGILSFVAGEGFESTTGLS